MLYVVTVQAGNRVLIPARSEAAAIAMVEKRLATRVVEVDILEAVIYSELSSGMAYLIDIPLTGDSP